MNKSKTRGQLISKLQYMKSQQNSNAIKRISYEDIDNICNYLLEDKNEIEMLNEENKKLQNEADYYKHKYCSELYLIEKLENAIDKACFELMFYQERLFTLEKTITELGKCYYIEQDIESRNATEWKEWCLKDVD